MTEKKRSTPAIWNDPDDAPELTAAFFKSADLYEGKKIKARGRPKAVSTKEPVKLVWMPTSWLHCVPAAKAGRLKSMKPCVHLFG
jgi:hypothetical protein